MKARTRKVAMSIGMLAVCFAVVAAVRGSLVELMTVEEDSSALTLTATVQSPVCVGQQITFTATHDCSTTEVTLTVNAPNQSPITATGTGSVTVNVTPQSGGTVTADASGGGDSASLSIVAVEVVNPNPQPTDLCLGATAAFAFETNPAGYNYMVTITVDGATSTGVDSDGNAVVTFGQPSTAADDYKLVSVTCGANSETIGKARVVELLPFDPAERIVCLNSEVTFQVRTSTGTYDLVAISPPGGATVTRDLDQATGQFTLFFGTASDADKDKPVTARCGDCAEVTALVTVVKVRDVTPREPQLVPKQAHPPALFCEVFCENA